MGKHFDNAQGVHFRLFGKDAKIITDQMSLITRASRLTGLTISEFCRMAAIKEAKYTLLTYHKEKVKIAKKVLLDEKLRIAKQNLDKENFNEDNDSNKS